MKKAAIISLTAAAVVAGALVPVVPATAKGMFDIMNPGRWFGNDDDDHYYRYRRYGGPYGYGYGGPYGWGGPYGYGGPYGPYGYGPYGYGGYGPGTNTIVVTPQSSSDKTPPPRVPE